MATLGANDLKQYALPTYWDAGLLSQLRLASGETYDQLINDILDGMVLANAALLSDPLLSGLISITQEASMEYRVGVSNGFQAHTEYGRPDEKRGKTTGHMLPLDEFDRGMGWTWDFLRKARRPQIDADIASAMADIQDKWAKVILTRLFKSDYTTVGSGRSMPLADGGTADPTYVPVAVPDRGGTFVYTHDHIHNQNGITQAFLEVAVANIWEHGYDAPYELLVSRTDISSWTDTSSITGFVPRADPLLRYGLTADLANVSPDYVGAVETDYGACRVRVCGRIPTTYWAVYKSFGALDQRNPLVVREDPTFGTGAVLLRGDHIREFPIENAILFMTFGVGVADRVAAAAYINSAGGYSTPTIT